MPRFARTLEIKERTLRKWRAQAGRCPAMGRPRHAEEAWRAAVVPVARAWKSQGRSSGLPRVCGVLKALGIKIPITIVRELLRLLKARWRRVQAWQRAQEMTHVDVLARDVLWSQDATHLGRDGQGKVEALAVKDVGTMTSIEQSVGGPARGEDVLVLLVRAMLVRGALPLVLAMDNGPANRNELVTAWLQSQRVIVLWNVPHTPQHNAWAESFNGELKVELAALGELVVRNPPLRPDLLSEPEVSVMKSHFRACVPRLVRRMNTLRVRPSRGRLTAAQLDRILPRAEDLVDRACFYATACAAIEKAVQNIENPRARRRAEREAILCTLERFGLVTRTRGRRPAPALTAARLS